MSETIGSRLATTPAQPRLVAYLRVSTRGQVDRWGLPAQRAAIKTRARADRLTVVRWETEPGVSGTFDQDDRPALYACLQAIKAGEVDGMIVAEIGRFARELTTQEAVLAKVWSMGGRLWTADGGEVLADDPDDPMRTAMRQMAGVFMQLDRAMTVKRMRNGKRAKAAAGGYTGGRPAFGTRAVDSELSEHGSEAETAGIMATLRAGGMSLREIGAWCDDHGHPPKAGGRWHPTAVNRVLGRAAVTV